MPPGEPWELASSGSRETRSSEAIEPVVEPAVSAPAEEPVDGVEDPSGEPDWPLLPPPAEQPGLEVAGGGQGLRRSNAVELQEVPEPLEPQEEAESFLKDHQGVWIRRSDQDPVATWTQRARCLGSEAALKEFKLWKRGVAHPTPVEALPGFKVTWSSPKATGYGRPPNNESTCETWRNC